MALYLEYETNHGVTANYWKIDEVNVDVKAGTTTVEVVVYVNEQKRREEKDYLTSRRVIFGTPDCTNVAAAYSLVKTDIFFANATDC